MSDVCKILTKERRWKCTLYLTKIILLLKRRIRLLFFIFHSSYDSFLYNYISRAKQYIKECAIITPFRSYIMYISNNNNNNYTSYNY